MCKFKKEKCYLFEKYFKRIFNRKIFIITVNKNKYDF